MVNMGTPTATAGANGKCRPVGSLASNSRRVLCRRPVKTSPSKRPVILSPSIPWRKGRRSRWMLGHGSVSTLASATGDSGTWRRPPGRGACRRAGPSWPSEFGAGPLHARHVTAQLSAAHMPAGSSASAESCARPGRRRSPVAGHRSPGLRVMTDSDGTRGPPVPGLRVMTDSRPAGSRSRPGRASHHRLDWASLTHDLPPQVAVRTAAPDRGSPN